MVLLLISTECSGQFCLFGNLRDDSFYIYPYISLSTVGNFQLIFMSKEFPFLNDHGVVDSSQALAVGHHSFDSPSTSPCHTRDYKITIMTTTGRSLHFSDSFVVSCGTVTVDVPAAKVLLIRSRSTRECFLPKGRKDVAEALAAAALRETFEETGVRAHLLPVLIATRATIPSGTASTAGGAAITEPLAVSQRVTDGVLKIIFWLVAAADSKAVREEDTQEADEDFDAFWVDWEEARATLTFDDDRQIAEAGIAAAKAASQSTVAS